MKIIITESQNAIIRRYSVIEDFVISSLKEMIRAYRPLHKKGQQISKETMTKVLVQNVTFAVQKRLGNELTGREKEEFEGLMQSFIPKHFKRKIDSAHNKITKD